MHSIFIYTTVVLYALLCSALRCLARSGEISNALLLAHVEFPVRCVLLRGCPARSLSAPCALCLGICILLAS